MTAAHEISAAREPIGIGKASTINFEIFEKCEFDLASPFLKRITHIYFYICKIYVLIKTVCIELIFKVF